MLPLTDLKSKAHDVRCRTLAMHKVAPGIRVASSLSPVEILTALYHGGLVRHDPANPRWPDRDRVIASKGHGCLALYPILADLGYLDPDELGRVTREHSRLTAIPEPTVPGIETTNGALGHGLGVACGMALALRHARRDATLFVVCGDGEMNGGAVWEAVMFAARHRLDNIVLVIDDNGRSMLGDQAAILALSPFAPKLAAFGWRVEDAADGHDVDAVHAALARLKAERTGRPKALVAHTIKGHGVPALEADPLSHVRVLTADEVDRILETWR